MANEIRCVTCGKLYSYCKPCSIRRGPDDSWKRSACSERCWNIAQTINSWVFGKLDALDAAERLKAEGVKGTGGFTAEIRDSIKQIRKAAAETASADAEAATEAAVEK